MTEFSNRPLGRVVNHDPRSLAYQVHADGTVASVKWTRVVPVLDQGEVGSCTGNAAVGHLGTQPVDSVLPVAVTLDESQALSIYSDAETIDGDGPYPPNDNGSSGLSVAKVCKNRGYINGYLHMTSLAACQTAIQKGPFIVGVNWYEGFDDPSPIDGQVAISGSVRGGHEFEVIGYEAHSDLWEAVNSWGTSYGKGGHFFFSSATFSRLLSEEGDATQFVALSEPPPAPYPIPQPPNPPADLDASLWATVGSWTRLRHVGANHDTAMALIEWALTKGYKTGPHEPEHASN